MLTTYLGCCAFESACALPSGVIRSFETTSVHPRRLRAVFMGPPSRLLVRSLLFKIYVADFNPGQRQPAQQVAWFAIIA